MMELDQDALTEAVAAFHDTYDLDCGDKAIGAAIRAYLSAAHMRPRYCLAVDEDTPCKCGATKEGNDPVNGVCQAQSLRPSPYPLIQMVLVHKETGELV